MFLSLHSSDMRAAFFINSEVEFTHQLSLCVHRITLRINLDKLTTVSWRLTKISRSWTTESERGDRGGGSFSWSSSTFPLFLILLCRSTNVCGNGECSRQTKSAKTGTAASSCQTGSSEARLSSNRLRPAQVKARIKCTSMIGLP